MSGSAAPYSEWSVEALAERVQELEKELKKAREQTALEEERAETDTVSSAGRPAKKPRTFNWSKYTTRYIALKFAYLGKRYNGFEHHSNNFTPLPTVEETVWKALTKSCLIAPQGDTSGKRNAIDWEGCDYSKCGRTDRGVSAFGQVIGLRVRSNRQPTAEEPPPNLDVSMKEDGAPVVEQESPKETFDDINDELPYLQILNSLLPPDIRMTAWCPSPPTGFSARFSCRERRYRYFFTQPVFTPTPGNTGVSKSLTVGPHGEPRREAWLDIDRMRAAAKRYEGLHDFRNFCKIDGSKQISDFRRRIFYADIHEVPASEEPGAFVTNPIFSEFASKQSSEPNNHPVGPGKENSPPLKTYYLELHGSAFLWHQVRHMMAVLFTVGQGLEEPEVIDRLLDASENPEKPMYEMAEETPLVLWDCIFPNDDDPERRDALNWVYVGEEGSSRAQSSGKGGESKTIVAQTRGRYGIGGLVNETWRMWRERKMDEILAGSLLNLVIQQGNDGNMDARGLGPVLSGRSDSQRVFLGGDEAVYRGKYVPLLQRKRMKHPDIINKEYADKHGIAPREKKEGVIIDHRGDHDE